MTSHWGLVTFGNLDHQLLKRLVIQTAAAELAAAVCTTSHFNNHWSEHRHVGTWNDALELRNPDLLSETVLNLLTPYGVTLPQWVNCYDVMVIILSPSIVKCWCLHVGINAGIILVLGSANERRRYNVTLSLIGWARYQNDPGSRLSIIPGCHTSLSCVRSYCHISLSCVRSYWLYSIVSK